MYFSSDFGWYLSILVLSIKNREVGGGGSFLNRQNLLSVMKVICQQSLNGTHEKINRYLTDINQCLTNIFKI